MSGATVGAREITIRGVVLGALITLVFTAANVYLGLRVGLTFATSIPAAVISMGVLRLFANHSVVENNIVQTIASAAGTLSSIIFVLPALLMIGWWSGFPYWTTAAVCALGGILGVMYSIPLRRALVTGSDLPYPEGVAGAEVLKIGDSAREMEHNRRGIGVIALGAAAAAGYALLASLRVINNSLSATFRVGSGATMIGASLSLALIGVGHLVGVTVGVAMIVGLAIAFGVMLPIRTAGQLPPDGDYAVAVARIFSTDVRFIGAGAIAVAAAWTFLKILGPILRGIADAAVSARTRRRGQAVGQTERDIPIHIVAMVVLLSLIPIGWLLADFTDGTPLDDRRPGAIAAGVLLVLVIGLMVAAVCGYMAGLIGSSNSPISGVGILVVVLAGLLIKTAYGPATGSQIPALVAYTVFTAALVFGVATISNDNAALTLMIPIGAFLGRIYDSWARWSGDDDERKKRLGVMLATGLIVGESLYGVLFAVIVATTGKEEPLAMVGDGFRFASQPLGAIVFAGLLAWLYQRTRVTASYRLAAPAGSSKPLPDLPG